MLRAIRGEELHRPPVWMMRQAGRYLPEYMELRRKYDFFTRVQTPELAAEITLQPIRRFQPDAAIIFSDILTVPQAMGLEVQLIEKKGPYLPQTIQTQQDLDALNTSEAADKMQYVYDALSLTKKELSDETSLIGFAGAPFTILCYMVEGQGSKAFLQARKFCHSQPKLAHQLLEKIATVTIDYLLKQQQAGADLIKLFDSWSGLLSPTDFDAFCRPYIDRIAAAIHPGTPFIYFPKGSWYALESLSHSEHIDALGIDWCITPALARQLTGNRICLQGQFDPAKLYMSPEAITSEVTNMIDSFGTQHYIANLGHGISPDVPVDHAGAFFDAVKNYKQS